MKFTLAWLKDHLETTAPLDDILYALTDLGLEVEEVSNPADRLKDFTIGKVLSAEKHPDADKLRVCQVATDEGESQIICGAPNARTGITVVIAKPGVYVPGIDTTIGVGKIRGIESFGMMCSEREMELSDEHDGIIELPSGEVGDLFIDWLAAHDPAKVDAVIEIAITPNRPDALGVRGIARDLAARGLGADLHAGSGGALELELLLGARELAVCVLVVFHAAVGAVERRPRLDQRRRLLLARALAFAL